MPSVTSVVESSKTLRVEMRYGDKGIGKKYKKMVGSFETCVIDDSKSESCLECHHCEGGQCVASPDGIECETGLIAYGICVDKICVGPTRDCEGIFCPACNICVGEGDCEADPDQDGEPCEDGLGNPNAICTNGVTSLY